MPKGGARPGAGAKLGSKQKQTIEKDEMRRIYREKVSARLQELVESEIAVCLGVHHMQARDENGQWQSVTDPAIMSKCLNAGESFYRISAKDPHPTALKNLFDRVMGMASQHMELTGAEGGPIEFVTRLQAARKRLTEAGE